MVEYTYDAWGNILTTSGTMAETLGAINPLRYRGYVFDQESGLYYLQSRYYNSKVGRFLNADVLVSTGQGFLGNNMFAYCNNSPVNNADVSGTATISVCNGDRNPLFIGHIGLGSGGGGGSGGSGYDNIFDEAADRTNKVLDSAWDTYNRGYAIYQEQQIRNAEFTLDGATEIYDFADKAGLISIGKVGLQSWKAAREFRHAIAYIAAPIPTPVDEWFAIGHALKGVYHLFKSMLEVTK